MNPLYHDAIERRLAVPLHEGPDKTTTLAEAIRRHVHAGRHGLSRLRPRPAEPGWCASWRASGGARRPAFTLAAVGIGSPWTALIHGGLVRRVITTFMGEGYPFPTPQALISQRGPGRPARGLELVHADLPAAPPGGAMGVPFLPDALAAGLHAWRRTTRGAGDFIDRRRSRSAAEGRVGYVRALVPDVALLHGWVADRAGNVIIAPPMNENMYGAMAARRTARS